MSRFAVSRPAAKAHARQTQTHHAVSQFLWRNGQALMTSLRWFKQLPLITAMTFCVIGITLALPTGLFVLLHNVQTVTANWHGSGQISLYLQHNTTQRDIDSLMKNLQLRSDIATVRYISPKAGLKSFADQSGFGDILTQLPNNPLPPVIEVMPTQTVQLPKLMQQLLQELKQLPHISAAKLDLQWLTRLQAIIEMGKNSVIALFALFAFALLLVVGYTVRLTTQNQRQVIDVMQLMGATPSFIRRPFLYAGSLYGLLGAAIAWTLIAAFMYWMQPSVQHLIQLYQGSFDLLPLSFLDGLALLILGSTLGWISAYIVVTLQLGRR